MSNKKNSRSIQYLNHSQNTSPGKTAFSFSKSSRFPNLNSETPNKFYNMPTQRSRRATSLGFGQKFQMINKAAMDPGLYETKGQFDLLKSKLKGNIKTTFGQSHENIFNRRLTAIKTPGPGSYKFQQMNRKSKFHMGTKLKHFKTTSQVMKIGPQTYKIQDCFDKSAKYNAIKSFRIKTQTMRSKLFTADKCQFLRGPGRYNPEKLLSLQQSARNKNIKGPASFTRQRRLKTVSTSKIGPGSYQLFSVFGDQSQNI